MSEDKQNQTGQSQTNQKDEKDRLALQDLLTKQSGKITLPYGGEMHPC